MDALGFVLLLGCAQGVVLIGDLRAQAAAFVPLCLVWAALACGLAWRRRLRGYSPVVLLLVGAALRLLILGSPPSLSDDLYRYLWEGRVQLAGFDPFLYAPNASELAGLRDGIWSLVNHREVSTIYPPGALLLFRGVASLWYDPLAWKTLSATADFLLLGLLVLLVRQRGGPHWAPVIYALHPLPILESAGSGHLESLALLFVAGTLLLAKRGHPVWALVTAAVGGLVKVLPAALLLPLSHRVPPRTRLLGLGAAAVLVLLCAFPFLEAGGTALRGLGRYYSAWEFNGALFPVLMEVTQDPVLARRVGLGLGGLVALYALRFRPDPASFLLWVSGALILLSPVVHPWYLLWALVPALLVGAWPWVVLSTTVLLSYLVLGSYDSVSGSWTEASWIRWVEYPPLLLAFLLWRRVQREPSKDSIREAPSDL